MVIYVAKFDIIIKRLLLGIWNIIIYDEISNFISKIGLKSNFSVYIQYVQAKLTPPPYFSRIFHYILMNER